MIPPSKHVKFWVSVEVIKWLQLCDELDYMDLIEVDSADLMENTHACMYEMTEGTIKL